MAEFETVFGTGSLDTSSTAYEQMVQAIAAFQRSPEVSPFTSKFDAVQNGTATFTASEANGEDIFHNTAACGRCHSTPVDRGEQVFSNFEYFNIGVPENPANLFLNTDPNFIDNGLGADNGAQRDNGKFKVPTLRNIVNTAPYMHNGVFATLREVIDFYSGELVVIPEVNENLSDGGQYIGFNLSESEKDDLEAFFATLTDQ